MRSDVLIENFKVGGLAKFGLDYKSLAPECPRLIYCSITGFGQTGPYASRAGYDLMAQGIGGFMSLTGMAGGEPTRAGVPVADIFTGVYAVVGVLAALHARSTSGVGEWVTTSILGTSLAWLSMHLVTHLLGGDAPAPLGTRSPFFAPYEAYRTADGYLVVVGTGGRDGWRAFCGALGLEELADDRRFATNAERVRNAEALKEEIEVVLGADTSARWSAALDAAGVPAAPVQDLADALDSPQVRALGLVGEQCHPTAGEIPMVRLPIGLSGHPTTSGAPPPLLDAHRSLIPDRETDGSPNQRRRRTA